jgi:hypothetical protein
MKSHKQRIYVISELYKNCISLKYPNWTQKLLFFRKMFKFFHAYPQINKIYWHHCNGDHP